MWQLIFAAFIFTYLLICWYLGSRFYALFARGQARWVRAVVLAGLLSVAAVFPLMRYVWRLLPDAIAYDAYSLSLKLGVALFYAFVATVVFSLSARLARRLGWWPRPWRQRPLTVARWGALAVALFAIGVVLVGHWNARHPVVVTYEIEIAKDGGELEELHILLITDIHFGASMNVARLAPIASAVERLAPDLILLGGDIVEGGDRVSEVEALAAFFADLPVRFGVMAVPGNHDRALIDPTSPSAQALRAAGVDLLQDEVRVLGGGVVVVGRDDLRRRREQRLPVAELLAGLEPSWPVIVLDHQPVAFAEVAAAGADLFLAGHTHAGQIFPANLVTHFIYENQRGYSRVGPMQVVVSSGYGTWGPDLRIGNRPEMVSLRVRFVGP